MDNTLRKNLKSKAHHLKPVILLGSKGLTQAVVDETDVNLKAHELIKVKISGVEREEKQPIAESLCQQVHAELVQIIGNIAVIYRKNPE